MAFHPEVSKQIKEIRQDKIHGASWISRQAIGIMNLAVEKSEAKNVADFLDELRAVGSELIDVKPSMSPITNRVSRFIYEVSHRSEMQRFGFTKETCQIQSQRACQGL